MGKKLGAWALFMVGIFFTFFPHRVHLSLGLSVPHTYHVIFGIVCLVLGGWMLVKIKKV